MTIKDFINCCVEEQFEWYLDWDEDEALVRSLSNKICIGVTYKAINENNWETLKRCIHQGRDVYHVARIVGYFSRIENWNKSKLGELNDRHKGNYQLE